MSLDEIVSSHPIHITGKKYPDSPKEGRVELRRIYRNVDKLSCEDLSFILIWAAYFGDYELIMEVIEKEGIKYPGILLYLWFPIMREVRKAPRFKEFVREIGLVDYWNEFGWPDLCHPIGDDDFVCD